MIHKSKFSEAWKVQPIGEICTSIVPGRNKPDFSVAGEYPWLTIDDLQQFYLYNSKLGYRVSKAALDRANGKTVPNNSVIMSCVGQFGIVGIAKTELVINQQLHAFICPPEIDSYFLAMALIWQKPYMERIATKTTVSYMNKAVCESIPIPIPPLCEQRKIAEILSTWDEAYNGPQ